MNTYLVTLTNGREFEVEAKSRAEAINKVKRGNGQYLGTWLDGQKRTTARKLKR
jgi:hypothetical protein